jgi:hypothetical protein
MFRKRVNNAITSKGIKEGFECKWSDVKCSDVEWTDVIYVKLFRFEVKWSEVSYGEVLEDKYITVSVLYATVCLYGCIIVMLFLLLCYGFFARLSILCVMFVPFCVLCLTVLLCVLFVCECVLDNCHRNIGALFDYSEAFPCFFLSCKANAKV